MLKTFSVLCISFVVCFTATSQQTMTETQNLAHLSRVWGFLKYYHPEVAKGKMNWDDELLRMMPEVKAASNSEELSQVLLTWIESLGKVKKCGACGKKEKKEVFEKSWDLSWTQESPFSPALAAQLKHIEDNRAQRKHHYAKAGLFGSIKLRNEPEYTDFGYPSEDHRLLCLFRYWNMVEYFFPYKYATDQPWDEVLLEMIPLFRDAKDATSYQVAMLQLSAKTDDSHSYVSSPRIAEFLGKNYIPVRYKVMDSVAIVTHFYDDSLAAAHDLRIGDIITKMNGKSVASLIRERYPYIPASNDAVKLRNCGYILFNGPADKVTLTIDRDGQEKKLRVGRYPFSTFSINRKPMSEETPWKIMSDSIGYVDMGKLEMKQVSDLVKDLEDTKAIIFDVRNYPRGTMYKLADFLNPEPREFVKFTFPNDDYPGKFKWADPMKCGKKNKNNYKGKVIILANEKTQSHAEFTCMALQTADNAVVIGSQTSGADGNVIRFELAGGFRTSITGLGVYYPDGRETQRIGIVPDIEIKPTLEGLRAGRDEVLEKAMEVAQQK